MSETMRGVIAYGDGTVKIVNDIPKPQLGPYDCLAKVRACGFCNGTDLHIINNERRWADLGQYPLILGHEAAGDIVELGSKVRNLKIGDRFMNPPPYVIPGNTYGIGMMGMVEYTIIQDWEAMKEDGVDPKEFNFYQDHTVPLPDDFSFVDGGVLLTMSECFSAAKNFNVKDKDVLVYGCGPMGIGVMTYMRILGAKSITCLDGLDERLETAKRVAKVDRAINNMKNPDALKGETFDRVIDIVGKTSILLDGTQYLRPFGVLGSMGVLKDTDATLPVTKLTNNTFLQMLNFPYGEIAATPENIKLIQEGKVDPKNFYSHVMSINDIQKIIQMVKNREVLKVIMTFDDWN